MDNKLVLTLNGPLVVDDGWLKEYSEQFKVESLDELVTADEFILLSDEQTKFYENRDQDIEYTVEQYYYMISPSKEDILNRKIEIIKGERRRQYKSQSDPLYIEYQKDLALGNTDKAELDKEAWLAKVKEIEENNPYPTE